MQIQPLLDIGEGLFIYARLFDKNGNPINIPIIPAMYSIAQLPHPGFPPDWSFGSHARVVGHVPPDFTHTPGNDAYYKVELDPPHTMMRQYLKQCMALPACTINKVDIQLLGLPDVVVAHNVRCTNCSPESICTQ